MVELVVRLVFSLAVVLGMLMLLTRFSAKKFRGGANSLVRVVHRQPLSRTSAVAVVTVGSRVLVIGTTEHQVQLLTELDPDELELPVLEQPDLSVAAPLTPAPDPGFEAGFDAGFEVGSEIVGPAMSEFTSLDELLEPADQSPADAELEPVDPAYSPRHAAATAAASAAPRRARSFAGNQQVSGDGPLAGSLLSAQTWKQAFAVATSSRNRDAS